MATLLQLISNAIFYCSTLLLGDKCTIRFFLQNFSRKFCYPTEINNKMDRVYVGNLPPDIRIKDIDDFFRPFGKLIFIDVNHRANPVYAYVQFDSARNAFNAVKARHGYDYEGYTLQMRLVENEVRKRRDVTPPPPPPPMINDYGSSRTGGNYSNSSMTSFQSSSNSQWSNNDRSNMQSQQQNMSRPNMSQQNMLDFSSNNRSKMQQQNIMSYPSSERPNNNSNRSNMSQQYNNKNRSNMQQQQYSNSNRSNMPQDNMMNYSNRNNLNMSNMNYTNTNRYNMQQQEDMNTMDYLKNSNWVIGNNGSWNSGNNNGWWNNGNNDGSWNNGNNTNSSWNTGNNSSWNNDNNSFWNNGNNNSWNNGNNGSWNNGNNGSWNNGNNSSWNSGNNNVGNNMGWNAGNNGGNNYNNNVPPYVYNPNNDPYARAGFEDSFTSGLSGSGRKWFNRYIRKGFSPEMARSKALEHRTVPYLRDDPKVNPDPNDPTNAALETIGTTILSLLSTNPADNFNNDNQIMPTFSNWGGDNFQAGFDMPGPSTSNARGGATMNQSPARNRVSKQQYLKSLNILKKLRAKRVQSAQDRLSKKYHTQIVKDYEQFEKLSAKAPRLSTSSTNPRNERQILAAASGGKTYTELTVTLRKKKQQLLLAARRMRSDPNKRIGGAYKKRMKILINEYGFPDIEAKSLAVHPMEKLQPLLSLKADCDRALNKKQDIFSVNKRVSSNDRKNAAYRNDINYLKMYEKRKFDNLSPRVKTALRRCLARIHKHEKDANLPLTKTRFTKLLPSKDGPKTNTTATTRKKQNDDNKKTVKNTNKSTAAEKKTNETTKTTKKEEDKKKDKSTDATTEETPEQHVEENAEENKNNEEEHHEQEEEGGGNEEEYEDAEHRENEENEEQNGEE